jgi:hypothetical protein
MRWRGWFTPVRVEVCAAASRPPHPYRPSVCPSRGEPRPSYTQQRARIGLFPIRPPRRNDRGRPRPQRAPGRGRICTWCIRRGCGGRARPASVKGVPMQPTRRENPQRRVPVVSALMSPLRRIERSLKIPSTVCGLFAAMPRCVLPRSVVYQPTACEGTWPHRQGSQAKRCDVTFPPCVPSPSALADPVTTISRPLPYRGRRGATRGQCAAVERMHAILTRSIVVSPHPMASHGFSSSSLY